MHGHLLCICFCIFKPQNSGPWHCWPHAGQQRVLSRIFWEVEAKHDFSFCKKWHLWLLPFNVSALQGGGCWWGLVFLIFSSSHRERWAEQQGVCCHNEAAPYERLGEAQGHGLHATHAGDVEMCPGDSMGLCHAQALVGSGRSAQVPCLSPATTACRHLRGGTRLWQAQTVHNRRFL